MFGLVDAALSLVIHLVTISLTADTAFITPASLDSYVEVQYSYKSALIQNENDGCVFLGARVLFVRDWEEVIKAGDGPETIRPAEPDRIAGVATVLDKKICPGKEAETVRILDATQIIGKPNKLGLGVAKGRAQRFVDMTGSAPEYLPKWYAQVERTISSGRLEENVIAVPAHLANNTSIQSLLERQGYKTKVVEPAKTVKPEEAMRAEAGETSTSPTQQ